MKQISSTQLCSLSMQTLPIKIEKKNRVNRTNTTQQKFLQWYIFYPFDKDTDHGLKMWQNLVLTEQILLNKNFYNDTYSTLLIRTQTLG